MSEWIVLSDVKGRQVRKSPSGIVVVEDRTPDGYLHSRVTPDGQVVQAHARSRRDAWLAARKKVRR